MTTKKPQLNPLTKINEELLYAANPQWIPLDLKAVDSNRIEKFPLKGCQLTLVCGVSTAGKDTLVGSTLAHTPHVQYLPRATSRPPRPGEQNGVDYFFDVSNPLVWSEYGGNIYAITDQVLERLSQTKNCVQIQGLLYGFVLKELLKPYGVEISILYIVPELLRENVVGSLQVVLERLYQLYPDQAEARLPSIVRELEFVFAHQAELKDRGVRFVENPPTLG